MALTVTSRGTGTHNTGATTLVPGGRTATLAVGSLGVLCIALDNAGSAGSTLIAPDSWTDAKANVWTLRQNRLYDNGAASAGIEMAFYTAPITVALLTTDLGTMTWKTGVSPVAKVWTWYEVIPSGANKVAYSTSGNIAGATAANAQITTASTLVGDAVIAGYFSENVNAVTPDADSTNGTWATQQTTTIGTTTAGVRIATQAKVQTTTPSTQSYDVTVSSQDRIAGYIMLHEVVDTASLPTVMALTWTGATPTVTASDNKTAEPTVMAMTWTGSTPTVTTTSNVTTEPTVMALTWTGATPAVVAPVVVPVLPLKNAVVTTTDDFARTVGTGLGGSWSLVSGVETNISVDGAKAVVAPGAQTRYSIGSSLTDADLDVLVTFGSNSAAGGANVIGLALHAADGRSVVLGPDVGGSILRLAGGSFGATYDLGAHTPGTQYHLKASFQGTFVLGKAWIVGDGEPGWHLATLASAATAGPATLSIGADLADNELDDFSAAELRDLTLAFVTPTVATPVAAQPTTLAMTWTGDTPVVLNPVTTQPTALELTWTGDTPDVLAPVATEPDELALVITFATPSVLTGDNEEAQPDPLELALSFATPAIVQPISTSPEALALALAFDTPAVAAPRAVAPAALALAWSGSTPFVEVGLPGVSQPTPFALALAFGTPPVTIASGKQAPPRFVSFPDFIPVREHQVRPGPFRMGLSWAVPAVVVDPKRQRDEAALAMLGVI